MAKKKIVKSTPIKQQVQHKSPNYYKFVLPFIFILAIALYSNTIHNGFVMDDGAMITENKTTQKGFDGIGDLFKESTAFGSTGERFGAYRPVTMSFFAIEVGLWNNDPLIMHIIHILLYAIACCIVYLTLRKLLVKLHPGHIGLVFAAHKMTSGRDCQNRKPHPEGRRNL